MPNKFDENMNLLRSHLLKGIYNGHVISEAELNLSDLSIYSQNKTFFSKINNAVKQSLLDEEIILTNEQVECLNILNDNNLFLSAPTSFGKTFIALEYIARNKHLLDNIVFVVPTISLMNELRKKCFNFFNENYILITSDSELDQYKDVPKKIMIVVPERISSKKFKEYINKTNIDLLVYDEIYKLKYEAKQQETNSRIIKMNSIYKYLIKESRKILLLGPFIRNVDFFKSDIKIVKFITNLNLVYNEIKINKSTAIFKSHDEKKFVYFKSPNSITSFINKTDLINNEDHFDNFDEDIIDWISENIHPEWYYSIYLKKGIGIHHGRTPLFLRKYIENEYSKPDGCIHTILCTSTLMEGINTPTNKLIIYDPPRGTFELNNLIGRVGRLNPKSPQIGKIYIYDEKVLDLYKPDQWIDLKILYETDEVITDSPEDEILYLEKSSSDGVPEKTIQELKESLANKFGIDLSEVIDSEIEISLLIEFINIYDEITTHEKEWNVINDIKFRLLRKDASFVRGLEVKNYSFNIPSSHVFDAVYSLMINDARIQVRSAPLAKLGCFA